MKSNLFQKFRKPAAFSLSLICLTALFLIWLDRDQDKAITHSPTTTEGRAIQAHDADHDGKLSKDEKQQMETKFVDAFDENGDGTLDPTERQAVRSTARVNVQPSAAKPKNLKDAAAFLSRMDQDADAQVTAAEAGEKRWAVLAKADENTDGQVTAQEWLDYKDKRSQ